MDASKFACLIGDFDFVAGFCGLVDCVDHLHEDDTVFCGSTAGNTVLYTVDEVRDFGVEALGELELCTAACGRDVDEFAVHIGEEFGGIADLGTALGTEQLEAFDAKLIDSTNGKLSAEFVGEELHAKKL